MDIWMNEQWISGWKEWALNIHKNLITQPISLRRFSLGFTLTSPVTHYLPDPSSELSWNKFFQGSIKGSLPIPLSTAHGPPWIYWLPGITIHMISRLHWTPGAAAPASLVWGQNPVCSVLCQMVRLHLRSAAAELESPNFHPIMSYFLTPFTWDARSKHGYPRFY